MKRKKGLPAEEPLSRLPRTLLWAVGLGWSAFCLAHYQRRLFLNLAGFGLMSLPTRTFTLEMILRSSILFLELGLFWIAAWGFGRQCGRFLIPAGVEPEERLLFSLALGAGGLSLLGLAFGACGWLEPALLKAVLGLLMVAAIRPAVDGFRRLRSDRAAGPIAVPAGARPALLILALISFAAALLALAPVTFYDALVYHLALPDLYLRRGGIIATPLNVFAGVPAGVEMLYLWLLPFRDGGSLCQLLHWSFGLLTAAAIASAGKRLRAPGAGIWAAAVFLSNPVVFAILPKPGAEMGWSFYLASTLLALMFSDAGNALRLAGVLAGLALGTKFQAILILPAAAVWLCRQKGLVPGLRAWTKTGLIAVAVAAPWGLKNIWLYGNPIYPFQLGGLFAPSPLVDAAAVASAAHARDLRVVFGSWGGFTDFIKHPWHYAFTAGPDSSISLIYIIAVPLLLLFRPPAGAGELLAFTAALWLPMNLICGLSRYSVPALAPLSLAVALFIERLKGSAAILAKAAVCALGLFGVFFALLPQDIGAVARALEGPVQAREYLSRMHSSYPFPPFPIYDWIHSNLDEKAKVLFMGEARSFHLKRDREVASPYAESPIAVYANRASSGEHLCELLRQDGITHVFMNRAENTRIAQQLRFTQAGWKAFSSFWGGCLEQIRAEISPEPGNERDLRLYRVLDEAQAREPHVVPEAPFAAR